MKVSIITPTHNSARFIKDTIESILAQGHQDWELLITDDASTDHTCSIVEAYVKKDDRIRLFRLNTNSGAAIARNHSIEKASGRFIAFCDSDDLWTTDKLEKQLSFMMENDYAFTFAPYHIISEQGKPLGLSQTREKVNYSDLLKTCDIGCLTAMYDTDKLGKMYMANIRRRQDYTLWLQILKKTEFAYSHPDPLGLYRIRQQSISRNKLKAIYYIWKVYREVEHLPLSRSISLILQYSLHGIRKYGSLKSD